MLSIFCLTLSHSLDVDKITSDLCLNGNAVIKILEFLVYRSTYFKTKFWLWKELKRLFGEDYLRKLLALCLGQLALYEVLVFVMCKYVNILA